MPNIGEIIKHVQKKGLKTDVPAFNVGDEVRMRIKTKEGEKTTVHPWEGMVIRKSGTGIEATFTVRKVSFGEGIERTFPLHSPIIESLKVVSKGKVHRAKLYYLRHSVGKQAKVEHV